MPVPNELRSFSMAKSPLEFMTGKPVKPETKEELTVITNANVDEHDFGIREWALLAKHMNQMKEG